MRSPRNLVQTLFVAAVLLASSPAQAVCDLNGLPMDTEVAEISTPLGEFCLELLRDDAPGHVDNFLLYLNNGTLAGTFFHRVIPGFIVQGAAFTVGASDYEEVPAVTPPNSVINEPCTLDIPDPNNQPGGQICSQRGNERGTVALAKQAGLPNSGTTSWFINLADNRSNLDNQNGGFTVFARVIGDGMDTVDAIAALPDFMTADDLAWMESSFQTSTALDDAPLLEPPLDSSGDAVGCFNPAIQTSVVDNLAFPDLFGFSPDPSNPTIPFYTLSLTCSSALLSDPNLFVGSNSQPADPNGCPDDVISVRTTGPRSLGFPGGTPSYFTLTCAEQTQALADRDVWQADFQTHFNQQLVYIYSANLQLATSVPAVGTVGALLLASGILSGGCWLLRRRDEDRA